MTRLNLNTREAQDQLIAFQGAILAGDKAAPFAYADWLEDNGHGNHAEQVRKWLKAPGWYDTYPTMLHWKIRISLAGKACKLVVKCTAFKGYYASRNCEGLSGAYRRGYVPTLSRSKPNQERLGRILLALGHKVLWIA